MVFTGGLFGFIKMVANAIEETEATQVAVYADTRPYIRSKVYPEYKQLREKNRDPELAKRKTTAIHQVRELVKVLGWPLWEISGFEYDDLLGYTVKKYRYRYDSIIAMSNDSDLYQLFEYDRFAIYKGNNKVYTKEDYWKEWGLPPDKLLFALAMMGTHNDVAGISNIGQKTALKLLKPEYVAEYRRVREQHLPIIERNEGLIKLPHAEFPKNSSIPPYSKKYNEREFLRFCSRFDIKATRWMCDAFLRVSQ